MADKLQVWKQALVHLEKSSSAFTLTSDLEARYVFEDAWPGVIEEAFNEGDWNFAKVSAAMVLNPSETPAAGWSFVFDYPASYLRTVAVANIPDFSQPFYEFIDQGGFLHANQDSMYLRFISNGMMADANVPKWPTMFWRFVALKLAFETCGKLTSGSSKEQELDARMQKALRKAKNVDARNENNKVERPGSWLRSRGGFNGYGYGNRLGNTVIGGEVVLDDGDV